MYSVSDLLARMGKHYHEVQVEPQRGESRWSWVSPFFTRPRWWWTHVLTEETQRHAEGGTMVWWPPGRSHLRMEAETGARPVRVRTARIAGNRNQEECVERLFLVLPLTARLYQQLDFRLLVSRTVRIHFYCFKASICGTSLRSSGKLPQLAWNML